MKKETERLAKEFFTCVQIDAIPSTNDIEKAANHMLALQSRLESLEKDAARLDWLESKCSGKVFRPYTANTDYVKLEWNSLNGDMRDAIDAAMKG